jgi:hypothetical protein
MTKTVPAFSTASLAPAFAHAMRDMHPAYTGAHANLRYGNELAQKLISDIQRICKPENWKRMYLAEANRLDATNDRNADYAEQMKQAAFALRAMAARPSQQQKNRKESTMKTPEPDDLYFAADWLRQYDDEHGGGDTARCAAIADWLDAQANAKQIRDAARSAGVPAGRLRARLSGC